MMDLLTYVLRQSATAMVLALFVITGALAQDFVPGSEDLPLMDALSIQDKDAVVFDDPEGRIVEAFATGTVSEDEVLAFYRNTLPELGWQQLSATSFSREDETLTLEFSEQDDLLVVRFTLAPQ
ncbi:hypothetical protein [Aestuariispira ectoiniformans]|uniref:hypothetical protein n=1 Tax=Aestuariispira ectoiniformans TaxID=2775080 RepID=UPI00223B7BFF|nr:hypothetical protein [Aestuariispira ectoiniformans]